MYVCMYVCMYAYSICLLHIMVKNVDGCGKLSHPFGSEQRYIQCVCVCVLNTMVEEAECWGKLFPSLSSVRR